jgi:hypothetical protein
MSARALLCLWSTVIVGHMGALPIPRRCCSTRMIVPACRSSWPAARHSLWASYSSARLGESLLWREAGQRWLCGLWVAPRQWRWKTYGR